MRADRCPAAGMGKLGELEEEIQFFFSVIGIVKPLKFDRFA